MRALGILVGIALLAGCGGSDVPASSGKDLVPPAASPSSPSAQVLELGKDDVPLSAGPVRSPVGFEPALTVDVPAGWTSVHRYPDVFDLGRPDQDTDGPLVVVAFSLAPESDAGAALAAVADRQPSAAPGTGRLLDAEAARLDIVGGEGPAFTSRDGNVSLDAGPGQRLRLMAADTAAGALMVAVLVPGGPGSDDRLSSALQVIESARLGDSE
jgi:hypothetical protein